MAEKIAALRRRAGWSQEELAEKMSISRQSVSKWESGASIPELDKILKMSELFGVTTDYLLKDNIEELGIEVDSGTAEETEGRRVPLEEANAFMELTESVSKKIAAAVWLFIVSPITLILLAGKWGSGGALSEGKAAGLGMTALLVLVAAGVAILIINGMRLKKYEYLEKEKIYTEYGVSGIVQKKKEDFMPQFRTKVTVGVVLFIVGVIPVIIGGALGLDEFGMCCLAGVLLLAVACGVFLTASAGMTYDGYNKLLEAEGYTPEEKEFRRRTEFFPGIYWCAVTAVYLGVSLYTDSWNRTWIIYAVAGVAFAAIYGIMRAVMLGKK
ncbi:MAG: helix-turn-helix domain-containing protein [Butyricicoccus sp.]|nr:helix-turn-helix domain-containing protein [Butyricicoccus sp.]